MTLRKKPMRLGVSVLYAASDPRGIPIALPATRWTEVARGDLGRPQRHGVAALERITPDLRAVLAAHVAFQLVDWRRLRPPDDIQRNGLVSVAAKASDFQVSIAGVKRIG